MNEPRRRGPIASILVGIWDAMNFTRRLIFNILFFGFLLICLAALGSGSKRVLPVDDRSTLVIAPEGTLVEQYTIDPTSRALAEALNDPRANEVQLRDLLAVLGRPYETVESARPFTLPASPEVAAAHRTFCGT